MSLYLSNVTVKIRLILLNEQPAAYLEPVEVLAVHVSAEHAILYDHGH